MSRILVGIPTRDRPEHLACLLSSLLFQTRSDFDVMIVESGIKASGSYAIDHPMVKPFVDTLRGSGSEVWQEEVSVVGKSEVVAVNRILIEAKLRGYDYVYKIDDDHVVPPNALKLFCHYHSEIISASPDDPVLLSGVTPWMRQVFPGASSPYDEPKTLGDIGKRGVTYVKEILSENVRLEIGHFDRYAVSRLEPTELASAANFFLKPDIRILWSDINGSSKYADAMWFTQLREFLQYDLFVLTGMNVWHVAALEGGVREEQSNFIKDSPEDVLRGRVFAELCRGLNK